MLDGLSISPKAKLFFIEVQQDSSIIDPVLLKT
jgi:hypothetical protein